MRVRNFLGRSRFLLAVLPAIYSLLALFTILISTTAPGGAYYRIIGVNPLAAMVGMVSEGALFYAALLIFGPAWWFFIGAIGATSRRGGIRRPIAGLGALLSLAFAFGATAMTKSALDEDLRGAGMSAVAVIQYALVGALIWGALVVTFQSTKAAVARGRSLPGKSDSR
jgi:hypothetical protein